MAKVICFGEIMLRLSPPGYKRFVQANSFEVEYGGGEANVCVSLANFGMDTAFISKIPDNFIGEAAINELRKYGVDTSKIVKGGERLGIYFLEKGASQRPSNVIYDRKNSAIAAIKNEDLNWDHIMNDGTWFHFTGITPALSDNAAQQTLIACKMAKKKGLKVSCDLNFRKNLWTPEKARQVMTELMKYVDVCIANEEDAEKVFGICADGSDVTEGKLSHEGYQKVAQELLDRFRLEKVAITLRGSISASDNTWGAMLYDGRLYYFSRNYNIHIVDRVGGGDSFGAGLIYAMINSYGMQDTIEFATAASCLKHSIEGDFSHVTLKEVEKVMKGNVSGRVQR
jgi:2-dehydro-3-deoxygluconokinase